MITLITTKFLEIYLPLAKIYETLLLETINNWNFLANTIDHNFEMKALTVSDRLLTGTYYRPQ